MRPSARQMSKADASLAASATRLAYCWRRAGAGGRFHLYIVDDGTGVVTRLVDDTCAHAPAWSPDGTQLVFVGDGGQDGGDL